MAYALSGIEAVVRAHDLRGDKYEEWLERAWRRTSAPKSAWRDAPWPRNFAEIDELLDPPVGGWGEGVSDILGRVIGLARDTCEEILEGRGGATPVRAIVAELARHKIEPPSITHFLRSPSSEANGFGRDVPPAFFREGVDREGFAASLHGALLSESRIRRREAVYAIANLGVASDALATALLATLIDTDREVCLLSETALESIVSPDRYIVMLRQAKQLEYLRRVRENLASDREDIRKKGIEKFNELVVNDSSLGEVLWQMARNDPSAFVRSAVIRALAKTQARGELLEDFIALLYDGSGEVRVEAATAFVRVRAPGVQKWGTLARTIRKAPENNRLLEAAALAVAASTAKPGLLESFCSTMLRVTPDELEVLLELLPQSLSVRADLLQFLEKTEITDETRERATELRRRLQAP